MDHYFTAEPGSPARAHRVTFSLAGRDYELATASGVFSANRLDTGTAVLLRKADLPGPGITGPLLDLGCGYGPIAVVLATLAPQAQVWAVDVNARARELAARNTRGMTVTVAAPEQVPEELRFAQIWANPPIRVGKSELHDLLQRWLPRLAPDGVAWLVVARHLGADSLQAWLVQQGWEADRHASGSGYRVLTVRHPANTG